VKGKERPRSTISHLEDKIAQLETELSRLKSRGEKSASEVFDSHLETLSLRLARVIAEPGNAKQTEIEMLEFLCQSPLPRFDNEGDTFLGKNTMADGPRSSTTISSIPRNVVQIMLNNYCKIYLPQYPAIDEESLLSSCNRIYENSDPSSFDIFTVAITLAISVSDFDHGA
jgi:hypothetical protein